MFSIDRGQDPVEPPLSEPVITEVDIRAIVKILADVAILGEGPVVKKRLLLEQLGRYIAADYWMSALRVQKSLADAPNFIGLLHSGFTPEQLAKLAESAAHPSVKAIDAPHAEALSQCHMQQLTLRLEDFDQQGLWSGSPAAELAREADVETFLASTRKLYNGVDGEVQSSTLVFYRSPGNPCFSERERRIAHIVLTEVNWLHTDVWPPEFFFEKTSDLPARHLVLLSLLVHGNSRQKISEVMSLSIHTVNTYVKTIFSHFTVNSQTELMQRFIYGNGHDEIGHSSGSTSLAKSLLR